MTMHWHILTGEYPPVAGGVADYTRLVAHGLSAAGDRVTTWTPASAVRSASADDGDVRVEVLPDHFGPRALARLSERLDAETGPHRVLVQYVPHAFGWKGSNVPFCLWLRGRSRDAVWVMFHEVAYPLSRHQRLALNGLGLVTRGMAAVVGRAAERIFVSIPAWEPLLHTIGVRGTPIEWLPVPSVVPAYGPPLPWPAASSAAHPDAITALRHRYAGQRPLIGHFGTFGRLIEPMLFAALPAVIQATRGNVLLLGRGSDGARARLLESHPALHDRVHAAGGLDPLPLSQHISACDCLFQPYPDGVTTRRTSAMAALAHGRPLVTTSGALTETLWEMTPAVTLCPVDDVAAAARGCAEVLADAATLAGRSAAARTFYDARFDLRHTLAALRHPLPPAALRAVS